MHTASADKLLRFDPRDDRAWAARCEEDARIAARNQAPELAAVTAEVVRRCRAGGADAVALTGSTARAKRTAVSDLDLHVVGERPDVGDLSPDLDIRADDGRRLRRRLLEGDDFAQWTLRFGCVLSDDGVLREAARMVVVHELWPDHRRTLARLPELVRIAARLVEMEDRDAAQDQVRAALTSYARAALLRDRIFPLARDELAAQLRREPKIASALRATIHEEPSLRELGASVEALRRASAVPMAA